METLCALARFVHDGFPSAGRGDQRIWGGFGHRPGIAGEYFEKINQWPAMADSRRQIDPWIQFEGGVLAREPADPAFR